MKDGISFYQVTVDDEVVCEGSAAELEEKLGIPRTHVSAYARDGCKFRGKYAIKSIGVCRKIYEISKIEDGELIIHRGTIQDIQKIVYMQFTSILNALSYRGKLLNEWDIKIVGREVIYD